MSVREKSAIHLQKEQERIRNECAETKREVNAGMAAGGEKHQHSPRRTAAGRGGEGGASRTEETSSR